MPGCHYRRKKKLQRKAQPHIARTVQTHNIRWKSEWIANGGTPQMRNIYSCCYCSFAESHLFLKPLTSPQILISYTTLLMRVLRSGGKGVVAAARYVGTLKMFATQINVAPQIGSAMRLCDSSVNVRWRPRRPPPHRITRPQSFLAISTNLHCIKHICFAVCATALCAIRCIRFGLQCIIIPNARKPTWDSSGKARSKSTSRLCGCVHTAVRRTYISTLFYR